MYNILSILKMEKSMKVEKFEFIKCISQNFTLGKRKLKMSKGNFFGSFDGHALKLRSDPKPKFCEKKFWF